MQNLTLPAVLQLALKEHVASADISNDDELQHIILKLSQLHTKIEALKLRAKIKRQSKLG